MQDCVWCLQLKGSLCVSGSSDKLLSSPLLSLFPLFFLFLLSSPLRFFAYFHSSLINNNKRTLRVWDLERGKSKQTYRGHTDCVCCLQVISHKNLILSGSSDSTIRCYDIRARDCVSVLEVYNTSFFIFIFLHLSPSFVSFIFFHLFSFFRLLRRS